MIEVRTARFELATGMTTGSSLSSARVFRLSAYMSKCVIVFKESGHRVRDRPFRLGPTPNVGANRAEWEELVRS